MAGASPRAPDGAADRASDGPAADDGAVDVGVLVAHSPAADRAVLRSFARLVAGDGVTKLAAATDVSWTAHLVEPRPLSDVEPRRPSDFLDDAAHRMVDGPFDMVVVVTDVPLRSRTERRVPGLASPVSRIAVLSTHSFRTLAREAAPVADGQGAAGASARQDGKRLDAEPQGAEGPAADRAAPDSLPGERLEAERLEERRVLETPAVRWNVATLFVHLIGHLLGAPHDPGGVMAPFALEPGRRSIPAFDADVKRRLERIAAGVPEAEVASSGPLGLAWFHVLSLARNPDQVAAAVRESRAPLLSLSLPRLATAALTPTLILVFSAEAWDVGFHLGVPTTVLFASVSVLAAAVHVVLVQNLSFPRKPHSVLTEHMALVNVTVFCIVLLAIVGLFALVWAVMLVIELVVFPPNLMSNWPSLEDPAVGVVELVRTGAFIATVGVLSGALAGGLESRTVLHHLALFRDRP